MKKLKADPSATVAIKAELAGDVRLGGMRSLLIGDEAIDMAVGSIRKFIDKLDGGNDLDALLNGTAPDPEDQAKAREELDAPDISELPETPEDDDIISGLAGSEASGIDVADLGLGELEPEPEPEAGLAAESEADLDIQLEAETEVEVPIAGDIAALDLADDPEESQIDADEAIIAAVLAEQEAPVPAATAVAPDISARDDAQVDMAEGEVADPVDTEANGLLVLSADEMLGGGDPEVVEAVEAPALADGDFPFGDDFAAISGTSELKASEVLAVGEEESMDIDFENFGAEAEPERATAPGKGDAVPDVSHMFDAEDDVDLQEFSRLSSLEQDDATPAAPVLDDFDDFHIGFEDEPVSSSDEPGLKEEDPGSDLDAFDDVDFRKAVGKPASDPFDIMKGDQSGDAPFEEEDNLDMETQNDAVTQKTRGLFGRFRKSGGVDASDGAGNDSMAGDLVREALTSVDAGEDMPVKSRGRVRLLAATAILVGLVAIGGYAWKENMLTGILPGAAPVKTTQVVAPKSEMPAPPSMPATSVEAAPAGAAPVEAAPVEAAPVVTPAEDAPVPSRSAEVELPMDPAPPSIKAEIATPGASATVTVDGSIEDLFLRDGSTDPVDLVAQTGTDAPVTPGSVEIGMIEDKVTSLEGQMQDVQVAIEERDNLMVERDDRIAEAIEIAVRAESMALAQNEILVDMMRLQDKMTMVEELIVDLSRRVAAMEVNDPADRTTTDRMIQDLNQRVEGLARDVGLVARVAINGSVKSPSGAGTRGTAQKDSSIAGSKLVYGEGESAAQSPDANQDNVPADVKVGDAVKGYGVVLDIVPTSEGGRVVVMENGSVLLPGS